MKHADYREQFYLRGHLVLPPEESLATPKQVQRWSDAAFSLPTIGDRRDEWVGGVAGRPDLGPLRRLAYWYAAGDPLKEVFPDLETFYYELRDFLQGVVVGIEDPRDVAPSPYDNDLWLKLYEPGDEPGWHQETNPLTAVLYLNDCAGGALEVVLPQRFCNGVKDSLVTVQPQAGTMFIFSGLFVWHRVPKVAAPRAAVVFSYYRGLDKWRPDGLDELHYG